MSDWVVTYDLKTDDKPNQPTGILAPNGKSICRVPHPVGLTASHAPKYVLKDEGNS